MGFVYRYANDVPPAPFVLVIVSRPDGAASEPDLPARVDTGADRTVIPADVAARLALDEVGTITLGGFGGSIVTAPVHSVRLVIRDLPAITAEVAAIAGEPHVLLGRDVLNHYRIVLDGPNLRLEIG